MATIPRFVVCEGDAESNPDTLASLITIDVPVEDGKTRRVALMFSTNIKAHEFIANKPGEWHVRCLDAQRLAACVEICAPLVFHTYSTNYGGALRKSKIMKRNLWQVIPT